MRMWFFIMLVILWVSHPATAQKFNLGLNAGVSTAARPSFLPPEAKMTLGATGSVTATYDVDKDWQIGLETGAAKWEFVKGKVHPFSNSRRTNLLLANPAMNISMLINYRMLVNDGLVYVGGSLGYIHVMNDGISYTNSLGELSDLHYNKGAGVAIGLQVGYTKFLNSRFGLNVQVSPKMAIVSTRNVDTDAKESYNLIYLPVSLGMRYRLGK